MIKNAHIEYLKVMFGKQRREWDRKTDDRGVFCAIYDQLIEAYEAAVTVDNNTIYCALNHYSEKEIATMKEISDYFTGKTTRGGRYFQAE